MTEWFDDQPEADPDDIAEGPDGLVLRTRVDESGKRVVIHPPGPLFAHPGPRTSKVACRVCGLGGWGPENPDSRSAAPWQRKHMEGHIVCGIGDCTQVVTIRGLGHHRGKRHPNPAEIQFPTRWAIDVCRTCGRIARVPFCEHREYNGSWFVTIVVKGHVPRIERRHVQPDFAEFEETPREP
jgi:hypothetical protein